VEYFELPQFRIWNMDDLVNSSLRSWVIGIGVFLIALVILSQLPSERANYKRLVKIASRTSGPVAQMAIDAQNVGRSSKDQDIKTVAEYLATTASSLSNLGATELSEVVSGSAWNAFVTGGLNSFLRPGHSLTAIGQSVWLWANESRFKAAGERLNRRYGGISILPVALAALLGWASVPLLKNVKTKEQMR
jgi:hypothetical protein